MSEIILIAACSQQKSQTTPVSAKINNLSTKDYTQRHRQWIKLITSNIERVRAGDLYIGQYWHVIRQIQTLLQSLKIESNTVITSAGCGLLTSEDMVPNYAATFQFGSADQVYTSVSKEESRREYAKRWWYDTNQALRNYKAYNSLSEIVTPRTKIIISLISSIYLEVIRADLFDLQLFRPDIEYLIFSPNNDPALKNLEVPPYQFISDTQIRIGSNES